MGNLVGGNSNLVGGNSNIFCNFHPEKLGKIPILTVRIFFRWVVKNHQPVSVCFFVFGQDSLAALSLFQVTRGSFRKVCR